MNSKGQGPMALVSGLITVVVIVIIIAEFGNIFIQSQCSTQINQINEQNNTIAQLKKDLNQAQQEASFWENEYKSIEEITITKTDIAEIKKDLNIANITINNNQTKISALNQEFNNYQITIFYFVISIILSIPLLTIGGLELYLYKFERIKRVWQVNIRKTHYIAINEKNEYVIVPKEK